jgi:hypothetical protein
VAAPGPLYLLFYPPESLGQILESGPFQIWVRLDYDDWPIFYQNVHAYMAISK